MCHLATSFSIINSIFSFHFFTLNFHFMFLFQTNSDGYPFTDNIRCVSTSQNRKQNGRQPEGKLLLLKDFIVLSTDGSLVIPFTFPSFLKYPTHELKSWPPLFNIWWSYFEPEGHYIFPVFVTILSVIDSIWSSMVKKKEFGSFCTLSRCISGVILKQWIPGKTDD